MNNVFDLNSVKISIIVSNRKWASTRCARYSYMPHPRCQCFISYCTLTKCDSLNKICKFRCSEAGCMLYIFIYFIILAMNARMSSRFICFIIKSNYLKHLSLSDLINHISSDWKLNINFRKYITLFRMDLP